MSVLMVFCGLHPGPQTNWKARGRFSFVWLRRRRRPRATVQIVVFVRGPLLETLVSSIKGHLTNQTVIKKVVLKRKVTAGSGHNYSYFPGPTYKSTNYPKQMVATRDDEYSGRSLEREAGKREAGNFDKGSGEIR